MAIYRGAGGAGDATGDSASEALLVRELAIEVQADADAAEAAKNAALAAQAAAELAETNAETAEANAETAETNAETAASAAASSASSAATSATNASNSATAAQTAETNAETAETNAAASASAAATSASNASTSANNAANSASSAASSASAAAASYDSFDDRYLGAKASDPTVDNDGSALIDGALYFDTTNNVMKVYDLGTTTWLRTTPTSTEQTAINTVSANITNVNTVAGISSSVTTVATNNTNVTTVATNIASVNTNATNIANINQNAANITAIQNASANATAAATSATAAASSATSAATSASQASAVALGNEPVRHSVRPSLLLDFANTKTLDPRITFTRASTGTFYDGKTVAKAEENLIARSQEFDSGSVWIRENITLTANTTSAPDGTTTAETIVETVDNASHIVRAASTMDVGKTYTLSVYGKPNGRDFLHLSANASVINFYSYATFNLSTGAVTASGAVGWTLVSTSITAVANGFYRCSLVFSVVTNAGAGLVIGLSDTGTPTVGTTGRVTYVGDITKGLFLWGAQLEQRSSVTAYTATTTAPITNYIPALQTAASGVARFEHNPVTGESLGLEIEEQRTNLVVRSEEFDNASWTKAGATITANTVVSPDGTLTSDAIVESTASAQRAVFQAQTLTATAYTFSVYAKRGIGSQRWLTLFPQGSGVSAIARFDINAGTIAGTSGAQYLSSSITSVGNGWYRCSLTFTGAAVSVTNVIYLSNTNLDAAPTYTGDGFSGAFIWGAQLEAGSFATSYIPTVASQVTRSADAASMTGTNFSSWYRADEGTLYSESLMAGRSGFTTVVSMSDGTSNNETSIYENNSDTQVAFAYTVRGAVQCNVLQTVSNVRTNTLKSAGSYKVNDFAYSANAGTAGTDTSGIVTDFTQMNIGRNSVNTASTRLNGTVRKIAYYPKRLTNAELQSLTVI